jgi:hypothetical protein
MSNQKLIRVRNGEQSTSLFTTDFNPPILIQPQSSVALQNLSVKLNPDVAIIEDGVNKVAFATVKPSNTGVYDELIQNHTMTIPDGEYTAEALVEELNVLANRELFNARKINYTNEQGSEILFTLDLNNQITMNFAARQSSEVVGPLPSDVSFDTSIYDYINVNVNNIETGKLTRTGATVADIDSFLYTNNVFCRGSGNISFTEDSIYNLAGSWTETNIAGSFVMGAFLTTNNFPNINSFPLTVGDTVFVVNSNVNRVIMGISQPGGNNKPIQVDISNIPPNTNTPNSTLKYCSTFTTTEDYAVGSFNYGNGNVLQFRGLPDYRFTINNIANAAGKLQVGFVKGWSNIASVDDTLIYNKGCFGYVFGLIEGYEISGLTALEVYNRISYGITIKNVAGETSSTFFGKSSKEGLWVDTGIYPRVQYPFICEISTVLGKTFDGANNVVPYKLTFNEKQGSNLFPILELPNYEYGEYNMVIGIHDSNGFISDLKWTENKFLKGLDGFYTVAPPDFINREKKFIRMKNLNLENDENVGYYPNKAGYITLNFFNRSTSTLFGYDGIENVSDNIKAATKLIATIEAKNAMNLFYTIPDSIVLKVDLPLESYDDGKESHILSFVPFITYNDDYSFIYSPSPPIYINLKNSSPMYLDHLTVRLETDDGELLEVQNSCSVVMLINSK